ncbi:hypothetical protein ISN44_As09g009120 [Arabidopsis suecica]|uniref:Uncharacterized protein n=1 Tax=Arabidopsis suecica TaxID=45249 RepID=A0A8T2AE74_ARASU|nr:hypothetical protein ISN44_As09g009120 [Arabidopsis suecica]
MYHMGLPRQAIPVTSSGNCSALGSDPVSPNSQNKQGSALEHHKTLYAKQLSYDKSYLSNKHISRSYISTTVLRLTTIINNKQQYNKQGSNQEEKDRIGNLQLRNGSRKQLLLPDLLTETGAHSGSSSSSSLRRLLGGQAALHRNVFRELSHELSLFWMNALSLEASQFIEEEGWRMADTCRASGDTWRSAPNPRHIALTNGGTTTVSSNRLLRLAESFHPRHIARDKWRNNYSLVKSSPPVGEELPPSSHRS